MLHSQSLHDTSPHSTWPARKQNEKDNTAIEKIFQNKRFNVKTACEVGMLQKSVLRFFIIIVHMFFKRLGNPSKNEHVHFFGQVEQPNILWKAPLIARASYGCQWATLTDDSCPLYVSVFGIFQRFFLLFRRKIMESSH